jgi:cytochrome b subunit of formate dehydrogenase
MELLRYGRDVWGEKVLNGASWDLIPVALWVGVAAVALHFIYRGFARRSRLRQTPPSASAANATQAEAVLRHAVIDRAFHWITAATMTALLITGLLPVLGVRFEWLEIHWIAGVLLTLAILLHIVRAISVQGLRAMRLRLRDLREFQGTRPGKYSIQQKAIHLAWSVAVLVAIVTGVLLMVKAGTPILPRNAYLFTRPTWGVINLAHGLAAVLSLLLIMVHVYFGLLPEKRMYLRSMVRGWLTRAELAENHDPDRVARGE